MIVLTVIRLDPQGRTAFPDFACDEGKIAIYRDDEYPDGIILIKPSAVAARHIPEEYMCWCEALPRGRTLIPAIFREYLSTSKNIDVEVVFVSKGIFLLRPRS